MNARSCRSASLAATGLGLLRGVRIRILVGVGLLLVAGCATSTNGTPASAGGKLKVVATTRVDAPNAVAGAKSLSPTGGRVLGTVNGIPCVFGVDGAHEVCSDHKVSMDVDAAAWSPDGTRVVFADSLLRPEDEPDIHVLDAATGKTTDLTDDGVAKVPLHGPDPRAQVDRYPSWSADGKSVRFARQSGAGSTTIAIDSIPADGGTVTQLGTIAGKLTDLAGLAFSPDAKTIAWSQTDSFFVDSTVHVRQVAGGDDHALSAAPVADDQSLLSFSPDGKKLLVDSRATYGALDCCSKSHARVYPSDGSGPGRPVAAGVAALYPTWAPQGQAMAFTTQGRHSTVQLVSKPGGTPQVIKSGGLYAAADTARLQWTSSGLFVFADGQATIYKLG
jgi:Tol biopolymer transport system component